jgi:hypothetical protein
MMVLRPEPLVDAMPPRLGLEAGSGPNTRPCGLSHCRAGHANEARKTTTKKQQQKRTERERGADEDKEEEEEEEERRRKKKKKKAWEGLSHRGKEKKKERKGLGDQEEGGKKGKGRQKVRETSLSSDFFRPGPTRACRSSARSSLLFMRIISNTRPP